MIQRKGHPLKYREKLDTVNQLVPHQVSKKGRDVKKLFS